MLKLAAKLVEWDCAFPACAAGPQILCKKLLKHCHEGLCNYSCRPRGDRLVGTMCE